MDSLIVYITYNCTMVIVPIQHNNGQSHGTPQVHFDAGNHLYCSLQC